MTRGRITPALAVLLSAVACSATSERRSVVDGEPFRLRVASAPYLAFAPLYVAKAEGIFARHGLDVELVALPGTEVAVPLLVDGKIDVLPGQAAPGLLNAIGRGAPIRLVGKVHDAARGGCSPMHIVTRPGLQRSSAGARLPIRRVSINRQALMRYLSDAALASRGYRLDSLQMVDIPNAAEAQALESGAVDAALAGEPHFTRTVRAGKAEQWIAIADAMPDVEITLIFFGRRLLGEHREVGARFLAAHAEALRTLGAGKTDRLVSILADATGEDPEVLRAACWPFAPTNGRVRLDALMGFQRWALARGMLDSLIADDLLWDGRFLEAAHRLTDSIVHP